MIFKYEKDLVVVLMTEIQKKWNLSIISREIKSGNNIADLVFIDEIKRDFVMFEEYFLSYFYVTHVYKKESLSLESLNVNDETKGRIIDFLVKLEEKGYVSRTGKDSYQIKNDIPFNSSKITAVEAKLYDWKKALKQAKNYLKYADFSYVAVDASIKNKVNKDLFINNNIGLIFVDNEDIEISYIPIRNTNYLLDIKYFIEDRVLTSQR